MKSTKSMPETLKQAVAACRHHLLVAAMFSALINILHLAPTIYMMQVYDRVVPTGGTGTLVWLTILVGLAIGCLSLLDGLRGRIMMRASLRLNRQLSSAILHQSILRARDDKDPGARQIMREFDGLRQTVAGPGVSALFDLPWTPLYLVVAFIIHPFLAAMILAGGIVLAAIAIANERSMRKSANSSHDAMASTYAREEVLFRNSELIRALGTRKALVARHIVDRRKGVEAGVDGTIVASRFASLTKFVRMFLQSVALGVGAMLAISGEISVGAIIAASVLLSRALQPIEQVVGAWPNLLQAVRARDTLAELFSGDTSEAPRKLALPEPEGYVRLDKIVLMRPETDDRGYILGGVSTWLLPGDVLGLIGPSGAGKSSLARIIAGAIQPDSGQIRIDEAEYAEWDPEHLAAFFGYLPQSPVLLPGTVSENISRFAAAVGEHPAQIDRKVTEAAKAVGIHDMILNWPGGYGAEVGEGGMPLSGGQAQRVALARAIYGDPKVLVLDEPNSALDSDGEKALLAVIRNARQRGAAILVVTHRNSLIGETDRLAVMKNGIIDRQGPRADVVRSLQESAAHSGNVIDLRKETS